MRRFSLYQTLLSAIVALLSGCSAHGSVVPSLGAEPSTAIANRLPAIARIPKIKHVIIIMQENRSFDNLFHGFPGADTVDVGLGHDGKHYRLQPWSLANPKDLNHAHLQFLLDYNAGRNDGFDEQLGAFTNNCHFANPRNHPVCWTVRIKAQPYSYVPRSEIEPYWTMAKRYALGDRTFESNNGPSYPSHQFMIAGQARHVTELPAFPASVTPPYGEPWGCDADPSEFTWLLLYGPPEAPFGRKAGIERAGPFPCFTYRTAAQLLDAAGISWSYYAPAIGQNPGDIWSAFDAIWPVRFGRDWAADVKSPETRIFNDIASERLAAVSWVVPSYVNSDHAGSRSLTGPLWVASIVNAIGRSRYWRDCAIIVLWDDWGGWYDHVVPPQYPAPRTGAREGLGFRVPVLVISPYAKRHYLSHRQHEIASSLHFVERVFGLPSLGVADARADAFDDMFDFAQTPAAFVPIPSAMQPADFLAQQPSREPPDY